MLKMVWKAVIQNGEDAIAGTQVSCGEDRDGTVAVAATGV